MKEHSRTKKNTKISIISLSYPIIYKNIINGEEANKYLRKLEKILKLNQIELHYSNKFLNSIKKSINLQLFDSAINAEDLLDNLMNPEYEVVWSISAGFGAFEIVRQLENLREKPNSNYYNWDKRLSFDRKIIILPPEAVWLQNYLENITDCTIIRCAPLCLHEFEALEEGKTEIINLITGKSNDLAYENKFKMKAINSSLNSEFQLYGLLKGGLLDLKSLPLSKQLYQNATHLNNILFLDLLHYRERMNYKSEESFFNALHELVAVEGFKNVKALILGNLSFPLTKLAKPSQIRSDTYRNINEVLETAAFIEFNFHNAEHGTYLKFSDYLVKNIEDKTEDYDNKIDILTSYVTDAANNYINQIKLLENKLFMFAARLAIPVITGFPSVPLEYKRIVYGNLLSEFYEIVSPKPLVINSKSELRINQRIKLSMEGKSLPNQLDRNLYLAELKRALNMQVGKFSLPQYIEPLKTMYEYSFVGIKPANKQAYGLLHIEGEVIGGSYEDIVQASLEQKLNFDNKHLILREDQLTSESIYRYAILHSQLSQLKSLGVINDVKSITLDFYDKDNVDDKDIIEEEFQEYLFNFTDYYKLDYPFFIIKQSTQQQINGLFHANFDIVHPPVAHYITSKAFPEQEEAYRKYLIELSKHMLKLEKRKFTDLQKQDIARMQIEEEFNKIYRLAQKWQDNINLVTNYLKRFYTSTEIEKQNKKLVDSFRHFVMLNKTIPKQKLHNVRMPAFALSSPVVRNSNVQGETTRQS